MAASPLRFARGRVDRGANALIGSATADVGHRRVDVVVGRLGVLLEQRSRRHHHAALAIATLRHVEVEPGLLHRVQLAVLRQRLDVVICFGPTDPTGTWQERVATPLMWTVQAPHWAMPQPYLVPVKPI